MNAIGFGQNVTGGGRNPDPIEVTKGKNSGPGTLADAIDKANKANGRETEIVIKTNIDPNKDELVVKARNLTIRAEGGAVINQNLLYFDCTKADNIWLTDLRFDSDGEKSKPRDTILIDATTGRGKKGVWIDHCSFEAYYDLNITSHAGDKKDAPPLLITVSHCRFHDRDPTGEAHRNHGALGIHGGGNDGEDQNKNTDSYATVYRNYFQNVRRRSPRSSRKNFVHAFNNVLENWGNGNPNADPATDQVNAMVSGNFGLLAAEANYFQAGAFKSTILVARGKEPGELFVGTGELVNLYLNGALDPFKDPHNELPPGPPPDPTKELKKRYKEALGAEVPQRDRMTEALANAIKSEAGARS
jgi:pectate lyase